MEDNLLAINPIPAPAKVVPSNQDEFDRVEFAKPEEYVDRAWYPSMRPRHMVTIKGEPYMAYFISRDDLAVLAAKSIPDPATLKVFPGWVISRYTVMAYYMRAVRTPHIREMIINDSYLPWLGDDAYETYMKDAPFAPFDDPELIWTLRIATPSTRGLAVFRNTKPRSVTSPRLRQRAFLAQARVQAKPSLRLDGAGRRALGEDLEGYQYDYNSFEGENTVTYPRRGVEYACEPVQVHPAALVTMALYGLNTRGHEFEKHYKKQIASLSWVQSAHEPCVFTRGQGNDMEILGTYVDDFIAAAPTQEKMDKVMTTLAAKIELKRQSPD
ncbi:hypothetical protein DYB35_008735 [Aphanomyces astaci]|uniref:Reverse transcriptase Ty1/copia-type domain-containing protein n=1 Tax=Aphanomyces astaci TaxID=112090 RepID=A0A3R6ZFP5_APHAT|nr:hypothetical protein DYB35_008735 [Aphanomyces astaci]